MVVSNLFESDVKVLTTYTDGNSLDGSNSPGFIVGTGDSDTVVVSFFTGKKLVTELVSATKKTEPSVTEFDIESSAYDLPNIVRFNESYFVSVFISQKKVMQKGTVLCGDGENNYLVFIPHNVKNDVITSGKPVCHLLGDDKQNPGTQARRTAAAPHIADDKIFVVAPYQVFKFDFCGTVMFVES